MEKRNIQISLEEAREWYNSGDSFKRELALKAYKEIELSTNNYHDILALLKANYKIAFNSLNAAKKAIDIFSDELNILSE